MTKPNSKTLNSKLNRLAFGSAVWWLTWIRHAHQLKKSAEVLWGVYKTEHAQIHALGDERIGAKIDDGHAEIALMLMGLALETLIKGLLVMRDQSLVNQGKVEKLNTHNLEDLLCRAGIKLTKAQKKYARMLTRYVLWQGRYPAPLSEKKYDTKPSKPFIWFELSSPRDNWDYFEDLFSSVSKSVDQEDSDEARAKVAEYWEKLYDDYQDAESKS